ncbi:hypothetical protein [Bacillus pseudomycoides]|uniref:hypothetical protein n=1 Tax=Bacillus pseudomycoides TaxID=64104 RepID=UPI000BED016C|nr:hypothetical protein [Bacillus pseudomycoides]MED4653265.1 hypothetical protein [Bacillus pseudomycoides]PEE05312.1 hypothetical protein CON86_15475 [Bacillus pseudomycoides]PEM66631.1 hypothetical protein CN632_26695 [Bacillus pseudomycoides]PHC81531.1 hypothetical protein COF63_22820 [Bacillus pseudomycoides]
MRECCFKISLSLEEAKKRYCDWMNKDIEFQLDEYGNFIDESVCFSEHEDRWTYFVDLEGEAFFGLSNVSWIELAKENSVTYANYDENFNAELIIIEKGSLIREFSLYEDEPDNNIDFGEFEYEKGSTIKEWNDVVTFLEKELII